MNRGLSVQHTLALLKRNEPLTDEDAFKADVLGWCVEWVRIFVH